MLYNLNICNCNIHISIANEMLSKYIINRYIGFVSSNSAAIGLIISDLDKLEPQNSYGINPSADNSNHITNQVKDGLDIEYISDIAIIVNDTEKNSCRIFVQEHVNEKYINLIGVRICDKINEYLASNQVFCIHSSVVTFKNKADDGIMFIGDSGVGKTSLAYEFIKKGEQLTNDDVAFVQIKNGSLIAHKNTQYIGMDDESIERLYSECGDYIVKRDGLLLDKNRIDLSQLHKDAFAGKIEIKRIVVVEKQRQEKASICQFDDILAYANLFKSIVPFSTTKRAMTSDIFDRIISIRLPIYKLLPANTAAATINYLYENL